MWWELPPGYKNYMGAPRKVGGSSHWAHTDSGSSRSSFKGAPMELKWVHPDTQPVEGAPMRYLGAPSFTWLGTPSKEWTASQVNRSPGKMVVHTGWAVPQYSIECATANGSPTVQQMGPAQYTWQPNGQANRAHGGEKMHFLRCAQA
ncbi:hypothetical protein C8R45DRAFT_947259 [Mycena sanguinolenta]|nr:hypothetical protein C8R45DRAFT_947259 [Mycena sanguinolenta]